MDRRILEEMKDPLLHLIRNSIDHGLEPPEVRRRLGKPAGGVISVSLEQRSGRHVELTVADDGAGLDLARLRQTILEKGLLGEEQVNALSDEAAQAFIFQSGFSTSPIITDLSGRGLGLSIVREKVEKLGGWIRVESTPGKGIAFRIRLPTTRATFRGVIVRVGEEWFVFPTLYVERVVRARPEDIRTVEGQPSLSLRGQLIALAPLHQLLGVELKRERQPRREAVPAVVVAADGVRMAFSVREIVNEHEILVKSLGPQLPRVRNVEGATVLENGYLAPILHVPDLLKSATMSAPRPEAEAGTLDETPASTKRILVVEDSITSRALLKNILEAARYDVHTAVDGLDGLNRLREAPFDLVVSDVEMPRLHGFELTERIRADKDLAQLPVVLVTARESREDRERAASRSAPMPTSSSPVSTRAICSKRFGGCYDPRARGG